MLDGIDFLFGCLTSRVVSFRALSTMPFLTVPFWIAFPARTPVSIPAQALDRSKRCPLSPCCLTQRLMVGSNDTASRRDVRWSSLMMQSTLTRSIGVSLCRQSRAASIAIDSVASCSSATCQPSIPVILTEIKGGIYFEPWIQYLAVLSVRLGKYRPKFSKKRIVMMISLVYNIFLRTMLVHLTD